MPRPKGSKNKNQRGCKVDSCNFVHYGRGFCRFHWERLTERAKRIKEYNSLVSTKENQYRRRIKTIYKYSVDEYEKMLKAQDGKCCLCNRHQSELTLRLNIEHDHITGRIRGLTCNRCNMEIRYYELFKNNPEKAKAIGDYLNANFISS